MGAATSSAGVPAAGQPAGIGPANKYFFLAGTFRRAGSPRTVTVPDGKTLFFPVFNFEADNAFDPPTRLNVPELKAIAATNIDTFRRQRDLRRPSSGFFPIDFTGVRLHRLGREQLLRLLRPVRSTIRGMHRACRCGWLLGGAPAPRLLGRTSCASRRRVPSPSASTLRGLVKTCHRKDGQAGRSRGNSPLDAGTKVSTASCPPFPGPSGRSRWPKRDRVGRRSSRLHRRYPATGRVLAEHAVQHGRGVHGRHWADGAVGRRRSADADPSGRWRAVKRHRCVTGRARRREATPARRAGSAQPQVLDRRDLEVWTRGCAIGLWRALTT